MATTQVTTNDGKGRMNEIGGFWTGAIDAAVMRDFVKDEGLDGINLGDTPEQVALALTLHFKSTTAKSELCKCTECGGESPISLEACPFCGDAEAVEDDEEDEPDAAPVDDDGGEDAGALASAPDSDADVGDDEQDEAVAEVVAQPTSTPAPKAPKEKKKMELVHTNGASTNGATKKAAASKALARATAASAPTVAKTSSTRELDKAVERIKKIKADGAVAYWTLGREVLEVNEKQLWKMRVNEDGKAAYKSFDQFVHHELNMSSSYAYSAIDVARHYKTVEEVRALGSKTKAMLVLKVPTEDRQAIIDNAENMSTQQIRDAAKESRAKHGSPKKDKPQSRAGAKGATSPKRESAASDKISVTSIVGSKTAKLHKRPDSMKGIDASAIAALPRAKKLTDQPFGAFEMANGDVQYFSILQKDGELVLKIETRRKE